MNMMAGVPAADCPYCAKPLGRWAEPQLIHRCKSCTRPLGRIKVSRQVALYRVMPMFDLTKIFGTTLALSGMVLMILDPSRMRTFVMLIAFALATYGLTDMSEGVLAYRTGIDRTARKLRIGAATKRVGWVKIAFGLVTLSVAVMGVLATSSITSHL